MQWVTKYLTVRQRIALLFPHKNLKLLQILQIMVCSIGSKTDQALLKKSINFVTTVSKTCNTNTKKYFKKKLSDWSADSQNFKRAIVEKL